MNETVRSFFFGCFWVMLGWRDEHQTNMLYFLQIFYFYSAAVTLVLACFGYKYVLTTQFIHTLLYKLNR